MKTERLRLTLLEKSDLPEVLQMFAEPDTFKYIKGLQNKSQQDYISFLNLKLDEIKMGKGFYWVVRNFEHVFVGGINLTPIPKTDQIQIGWQIKTAFRQQGIALEAASAVFDFALAETSFNPIYAVFEPENIASRKIVDKLNFQLHERIEKENNHLLKYVYRR